MLMTLELTPQRVVITHQFVHLLVAMCETAKLTLELFSAAVGKGSN